MIQGKVKTDVSGMMAILSEAKQRRVTLKGVKEGAKILKLAARSGAPKRPGSGALAQAQGIKAAKGSKGKTISYAVQGARKKVVKMVRTGRSKKAVKAIPALYDHLVQFGTKPHAVGKLRKGRHPGAKPNPYRKQAWVVVKDQAGKATLDAMGAEVQKLIDKQRVKAGK